MSSPFDTSHIDDALAQVQSEMGVDVTYHTKGGATIDLTAVVGQTDDDDEGGDSFRGEGRFRDYIMMVEDLAIAGVPHEPGAGDHITEDGSAGVEFRVSKRPGEGCWRHTTPRRSELRVHTIEKAVSA